MALPRPIEIIVDEIEADTKKYVHQHISEQTHPFPRLSLNGTCEKYGYSVDDLTKDLLGKYIAKVQNSSEYRYINPEFDEAKYIKRANIINRTISVSTGIVTTIATTLGSYILARNLVDQNFQDSAYIFGLFGGFAGLLMSSLFSSQFMALYEKSRFSIGTKQYENNWKEKYKRKIIRHIKKVSPMNSILKYDAELHKSVETNISNKLW